MQPISGIHHITAFARNPQTNVDFYHNLLGQRLVKKTVNFDDPHIYHLYYGDETGTPGTLITFFPWPMVAPGVPGNGEVAAISYAIRPASVEFWRDHLTAHGVAVSKTENRFGAEVLSFRDPDGMVIELIATSELADIRFWAAGPIPEAHTICGFYGATLWVAKAQPTARLLIEQFGYQFVKQEGNRWQYRATAHDRGIYLDLLERPGLGRGRTGGGTVHHIAFRVANSEEQELYRNQLSKTGLQVTPVRDRQYFHSIYFREPGGVLFEIATDGPGFTIDESPEQLGSQLKLPHWMESYRADVELGLPNFVVKPVGKGEE